MNRFGTWLTAQREARGWKQLELAQRLQCEQSLIARWEAGECLPRLHRFGRLMRVLRADANKVLRLVDRAAA